jgi:hypothetical protein
MSEETENIRIKKTVQYILKRVANGYRLKSGTYDKYINYLRKKPTSGNLEKHHIVPRHSAGLDIETNLIQIMARDHILAHLLRFLEIGETGDKLAYIFRRYTHNFDLSTHGKKIAAIHKINGTGFYNSELQRKLGLRGGKLGGSKNTQKQWDARSKVGKQYGVQVGKSNQSELLQDNLACTLVFRHKDAPNIPFTIPPSESAAEVKRKLIRLCEELGYPELSARLITSPTGGVFYNLVKGKRPTAYGWSMTKIPIELSFLNEFYVD